MGQARLLPCGGAVRAPSRGGRAVPGEGALGPLAEEPAAPKPRVALPKLARIRSGPTPRPAEAHRDLRAVQGGAAELRATSCRPPQLAVARPKGAATVGASVLPSGAGGGGGADRDARGGGSMNLVEIHILQAIPPANLNRDDTGSPKDALFGGARRARISSQAQKQAVRRHFADLTLLNPSDLAVRTRLLIERELVPHFTGKGRSPEETRAVATAALGGLGLAVDPKQENRTEYLLFLGRREIERLAEVIEKHWDTLLKVSASEGKVKHAKDEAQKAVPDEVKKALKDTLNGGKAVDLALFGRMLADRPELGMDPACQVAHAISTHRVDREFDFYTAVDDLSPREQTGAGMMGDVEYYTAILSLREHQPRSSPEEPPGRPGSGRHGRQGLRPGVHSHVALGQTECVRGAQPPPVHRDPGQGGQHAAEPCGGVREPCVSARRKEPHRSVRRGTHNVLETAR